MPQRYSQHCCSLATPYHTHDAVWLGLEGIKNGASTAAGVALLCAGRETKPMNSWAGKRRCPRKGSCGLSGTRALQRELYKVVRAESARHQMGTFRWETVPQARLKRSVRRSRGSTRPLQVGSTFFSRSSSVAFKSSSSWVMPGTTSSALTSSKRGKGESCNEVQQG